jgi:O-antigen/teichoic acid export membrane protein
VAILGGVVLCGIVFVLQYIHHPFSSRVVDLLSLVLLSVANICNVYISGLAIYLRAHKKEPFLLVSIIGGILTGISTYFIGRDYGIIGMSTGYCLLNLTFGVTSGTWIFISKRKQWHSSRV